MNSISQLTQTDVFTIKHVSSLRPEAGVPLRGEEWSSTLNQQGALVETEKRPYDSTVFAQSKQSLGYVFSIEHGYRIAMPQDEKFLELVKDCGIIYKTGPNAGKKIEEVNLMNPRDPFITSEELRINLDEFEGSFDYTQSINKIRYALMKADDRFLVLENIEELPDPELISYKVEFIVSRKSFTQEAKLKGSIGIRAALKNLEIADLKILKTVALIWGLDYDENTSEKILKDQIGFHLIENKKVPNSDLTYLQSFTQLLGLDNKQLTIKALIKEGMKRNVIRATKNGFSFKNIHLGMEVEDVENFLNSKDQENAATLYAIQQKLEGKEES